MSHGDSRPVIVVMGAVLAKLPRLDGSGGISALIAAIRSPAG